MPLSSDSAPKHGAHFQNSDPLDETFEDEASEQAPSRQSTATRGAAPLTGAVMTTTRVSKRTAQATRRAQANVGQHRNQSREHHGLSIITMLIVGALIFGGAAYFARGLFDTTDDTPQIEPGLEVNVTIPDGAGGAEIAQILLEAGVITDQSEFFYEVKSQEAEMTLKSGSYTFVTGANTREVVKQLVSGPNSTVGLITIPEGYTVAQIALVCESELDIPADEFLERAKASNYVNDYPFLSGVADDSLEGYLFPKTYDFGGKEATADTVIRTMLNQFQSEISDLSFDDARSTISSRYGYYMSDYELMTLASIIEKEASADSERATIASVFYNRMMAYMPLQSDATVGYVIDHEVTADDLELDTPYNTYFYYGVTPTPICNPGIESIRAALNPEESNYYYFLHYVNGNGDRVCVFSENYDEHLAAIAEAEAVNS